MSQKDFNFLAHISAVSETSEKCSL